MTDVSMSDDARLEATLRAELCKFEELAPRALQLVAALPLPQGLLPLGLQLGETESDLRTARREYFAEAWATVATSNDSAPLSRAGLKTLQQITGRRSAPEIILELIDLKMVTERLAKVQSMGRA